MTADGTPQPLRGSHGSDAETATVKQGAVGLSLDAFSAQWASAGSADLTGEQSPEDEQPPLIPPAVLLPRFRDEPVDCDLRWPPHPRGCGDIWPPEGRIEPPQLPGRMPIGYAWPMLRHGAHWAWSWEGRASRISPAEAIARMARFPANPTGRESGDTAQRTAALVPPEPLPATARRRLSEGLRRFAPAAMLIDTSPAALAGAAQPGSARAGPTAERRFMLHLHLGFDRWHAAVLDRSGAAPEAHDRGAWQQVLEPLPGIGLSLMHAIADRAINMSYRRGGPERTWQLLWATPWANDVLDVLAGRAERLSGRRYGLSDHVCRRAFLAQQARLPVQQASGAWSGSRLLYGRLLDPPPDQATLRDWLQAGRRRIEQRTGGSRSTEVLVTGGLALLPDERGGTLAEQFTHQLQPHVASPAVQGRELPDDVLARGAAAIMATNRG